MTPKAYNQSIFSDVNSGFRILEWSNNQYVLLSDASDGSVTASLPSGTWTVKRYDVVGKSTSTLSSSATGTYAFSTPGSRACMTVFTKTGERGSADGIDHCAGRRGRTSTAS